MQYVFFFLRPVKKIHLSFVAGLFYEEWQSYREERSVITERWLLSNSWYDEFTGKSESRTKTAVWIIIISNIIVE